MEYPETLSLIRQSGIEEALAVEALFQAHQPTVYRLALSILDDPAEAEEATEDALLAAVNALANFRGEAAFSTWLYSITLNVCRGRLRKRQSAARLMHTLQAMFQLVGGRAPHPEEAALQTEREGEVWQAVRELDEKHRLPILLRYYHDFSVSEIAGISEINEGTVRSRLHTAREHLRGRLRGRLAQTWLD